MQTFQIDGLNRLKSLKIENDSFFHCESLELIGIGEYSFCDFAGEFELKNLPQLQSIQIGKINEISANFYASSLVIRGIAMMMYI